MTSPAASDSILFDFMQAAAALVEDAIASASQADPAGTLGLAKAMQAGAMLVLRATLTTTGLASVAIDVMAPSGDALGSLMSCELQRKVQQ